MLLQKETAHFGSYLETTSSLRIARWSSLAILSAIGIQWRMSETSVWIYVNRSGLHLNRIELRGTHIVPTPVE